MTNNDSLRSAKLVDLISGEIHNIFDDVVVGRGKDNDIIIRGDLSVSRRHARIYFEDGRFYLEDLSSSNGSLLNGLVLAGRTVLWPNDQINLGRSEFIFLSDAGLPNTSATPVRAKAQALAPRRSLTDVLKSVCARVVPVAVRF